MEIKDDHYRLLGIYTLVVMALTLWAMSGLIRSCHGSTQRAQRDTVFVERWDTLYITHVDTVPMLRTEKVIRYVHVKDSAIALHVDSNELKKTDSVDMMPVVQKTFGDDSTYTAWVSGVKYAAWPKLDSIRVRNKVVVHDVVRTITEKQKRSRWGVGIQAGIGYGLTSRQFEPYVGFGGSYTIFP